MTYRLGLSLGWATVFIAALAFAQQGTNSAHGASQKAKPVPSPYQAEVVCLLPQGFIPSEISRPAGPFLLVIRNYDHSADITLDVPAADQSILPAGLTQYQDSWSGLVVLAAGNHVLQDHAHSQRQLTIVLTP